MGMDDKDDGLTTGVLNLIKKVKIMTIDPEKEYSLIEIVKLGVLGKGNQKVAQVIWKDAWQENDTLKTKITGTGKGARYKIKGKHLLNYLNKKV